MKPAISLDGLRTLMSPRQCVSCNAPLAAGDCDLCEGCYRELPWLTVACPGCALPRPDHSLCPRCQRHPPPQDAAWAAFHFEPPIRQAILRLKYSAGFSQANWLGHAMAEHFKTCHRIPVDRLLPVPLHAMRLRKRGFNQALELARVVGRELDMDVDWQALQRLRATADQIGQSRAARRRNLRGAFRATTDMKNLNVAIVDDVMTTGSTLEELARQCRKAGAARVEVWAVARA